MTNALNAAISLTDALCDFVRDNFAMVAFGSILTVPAAVALAYII
ncbi:hypothetical protein [Novilysobacter arseniciresistens]|nr:hypothetical protein [Lysobacter arseniciresistens]